jgi:hypothetical protein
MPTQCRRDASHTSFSPSRYSALCSRILCRSVLSPCWTLCRSARRVRPHVGLVAKTCGVTSLCALEFRFRAEAASGKGKHLHFLLEHVPSRCHASPLPAAHRHCRFSLSSPACRCCGLAADTGKPFRDPVNRLAVRRIGMPARGNAVSVDSTRPATGPEVRHSEAAAGPVNGRLPLRNGGKVGRHAADLACPVSFSPGH